MTANRINLIRKQSQKQSNINIFNVPKESIQPIKTSILKWKGSEPCF